MSTGAEETIKVLFMSGGSESEKENRKRRIPDEWLEEFNLGERSSWARQKRPRQMSWEEKKQEELRELRQAQEDMRRRSNEMFHLDDPNLNWDGTQKTAWDKISDKAVDMWESLGPLLFLFWATGGFGITVLAIWWIVRESF